MPEEKHIRQPCLPLKINIQKEREKSIKEQQKKDQIKDKKISEEIYGKDKINNEITKMLRKKMK